MDFGKEAIEKIEDLVKSSLVVNVDGKSYTAKNLTPVVFEPTATPITISTLTGFVGFINQNIDMLDLSCGYITVIDDVNTVRLCSALFDETRNREELLNAKLDENMETFPFGDFLEQEDFTIKLHSLFEKKEGDDFDYVSSVVSKIVQSNSTETEDDGITQHVTIRKGASGALKETTAVKHIVKLSPYRTFREIEQVESQFLLRINADNGKVRVALFEADGGAWRNEARTRIAAFLKDKIDTPVIA